MNHKIAVEVPAGLQAGDEFVVDIETGAIDVYQVVDTPLSKFTIDQLKTERINARSCLRKARKAGRDTERYQHRYNAVCTELSLRGVTPVANVNIIEGLFVDETVS